MKSTGLVFKSRDYIGSVSPPSGTLEDESRFGNDGTITNALWIQLPSGLWILRFDGTGDWIIFGDTPFDFERTDAFALKFWIKITSSTASSIFAKQANSGNYEGISLELDVAGTVSFNMINDVSPNQKTRFVSTNTVNDDVWHHVLCLNKALSGGDLTDAAVYIDGALETASVTTDTLGANSILNNVNLRIGSRDGGGQPLTGDIGLPRVFSYAPSADEIAAIFQAERHWFGV